jgi:hypothetical protein
MRDIFEIEFKFHLIDPGSVHPEFSTFQKYSPNFKKKSSSYKKHSKQTKKTRFKILGLKMVKLLKKSIRTTQTVLQIGAETIMAKRK